MRQDREVPGSIPADAARRYKSVWPMELWPGNCAEPRAVTWGLRILDKGNGLQGAARTRGVQCTNLYADTTPLSAQIAEWHVHKDLFNT